jgi:hypothetical protein
MANYAKWLRTEHQLPFQLVQSYYTKPIADLQGFSLIKNTVRVGIYENKVDKQYIIVCKGTDPTAVKDIFDDLRIGGFMSGEISIDQETRNAVAEVLKKTSKENIVLTGHSLGGRAAMTVAGQYGLKAVVFNPAAPILNPLTKGPGADKAVAYHIVGDLISSHVSPKAGEVIRVNQGYNVLQTLSAHKLENFYDDKPTHSFYSVDQEDAYMYSAVALAVWSTVDSESLERVRKLAAKVSSTPIPGSLRERDNSDRLSMMKFGNSVIYFVGKVDSLDTEVRIVQNALKVKETGFLATNVKKATQIAKFFNVTVDATERIQSLGANIQQLRFFESYVDYQTLRTNLTELNDLGKSILGRNPNLKESNVLLTKSHNLPPTELLEAADLQMIGMEDEVLAKIEFSTKTPNPAQYLEETADLLPHPTKQLEVVQYKRLEWQNNPLYEPKDRPIFKGRKRQPSNVWKYNPLYQGKPQLAAEAVYGVKSASVFSKVKKTSGGVAKQMLRQVAKVAARTAEAVFSKLVPLLAAADLAYTTYLLVKGIYTGNYNDVVEYVTGVDIDTWNNNIKLIKQGPVEYWRPHMENIRPSCERCPPGTALYWDGQTCQKNPCEKRDGQWGTYDKNTGTCSYNQVLQKPVLDLAHPGWNIPVQDDPMINEDTALEQDIAMKDFMDKKAQWEDALKLNGTGNSLSEWIVSGTRDKYLKEYSWENICPK